MTRFPRLMFAVACAAFATACSSGTGGAPAHSTSGGGAGVSTAPATPDPLAGAVRQALAAQGWDWPDGKVLTAVTYDATAHVAHLATTWPNGAEVVDRDSQALCKAVATAAAQVHEPLTDAVLDDPSGYSMDSCFGKVTITAKPYPRTSPSPASAAPSTTSSDAEAGTASGAFAGEHLSDAAVAKIADGISSGQIPPRSSTAQDLKPAPLVYQCQGNGVVGFADHVPDGPLSETGVTYFRATNTWALDADPHHIEGLELCYGDHPLEGVDPAQIATLKKQVQAGVLLDDDSHPTALTDVIYDGSWTPEDGEGGERLVFVGYDPALGQMTDCRYLAQQQRWVRR